MARATGVGMSVGGIIALGVILFVVIRRGPRPALMVMAAAAALVVVLGMFGKKHG